VAHKASRRVRANVVLLLITRADPEKGEKNAEKGSFFLQGPRKSKVKKDHKRSTYAGRAKEGNKKILVGTGRMIIPQKKGEESTKKGETP